MYQPTVEMWREQEENSCGIAGLQVLAVPTGAGAGDPRTAMAPACLAKSSLAQRLRRSPRPAVWRTVPTPGCSQDISPEGRFRRVLAAASQTARCVERAVAARNRFLVLGGDHSIAAGTWAGAARALRKVGKLGLVWIDAHMDAHTPETSPSGNWHGMPVAHLLGHGRRELAVLAGGPAAVDPENLCLLGVRSYEIEEVSLLKDLGVSVIHADEVKRAGPRSALRKALAIAGRGTVGVGISLDLDAIDPNDAPGVGTPVPHGMAGRALVRALQGMAAIPEFVGLEIVEYTPALDRQGRTRALVADIAAAAVAPKDLEGITSATIAF